MHHSKAQRHFLTYTIEHILGALFVLSVALFVGYGAYAESLTTTSTSSLTGTIPAAYILPTPTLTATPAPLLGKVYLNWSGVTAGANTQAFAIYRNEQNIANVTVMTYVDSPTITPGTSYVYYVKTIDTSGNASPASNLVTITIPNVSSSDASSSTANTTTSTTPNPTPAASTTLSPVSFGVTVAPITDCSNGTPMTEVFFVVSDPTGGIFELSSDSGIKNAPLEWGRYPFTNGIYKWKAVTKSGYTLAGEGSGAFTLSGSCPKTVIATTSSTKTLGTQTATSDAFPLKYPENSDILPSVSIDNVRIKEGDRAFGMVTLDVVAKGSSRTVFVLENATGMKQYIDKQLGVTRKEKTEEWSVLWNTANLENGDYTLSVLVDTTLGTQVSKKFSFTIKNIAASGESQSAIPSKKPILKIYLNNQAIPSGATVLPGSPLEFRVGAVKAKKVSFYAMVPNETSPISVGVGVIDDLLSGKTEDVWSASWESADAKSGAYKLFARVLFLDGTSLDSVPLPITIGTFGSTTSGGSARTSEGGAASDTYVLSALVRKEILSRVTEPSACKGDEECKVFCSSTSANERCVKYAQAKIAISDDGASLADGVSKERLLQVLSDVHRRSDIPDIVESADDLLKFCADLSHSDNCARMLVKNDLVSTTSIEEKKIAVSAANESRAALLAERIGARVFLDSDGDDITDYDEVNIFHTDPSVADTDHDGVPDGVEIMDHTNPHGKQGGAMASSTESTSTTKSKIDEGTSFEDPLLTGAENKHLLLVTAVSVAEVGIGNDGTTTAKKLLLSGIALPNSFVTLYIFSSPIVVSVKADASGAWRYTLDRELDDGSHQVISAITDDGGRILAKSEPLPFVKVAAAVSVGNNALLPSSETPGFFTGTSLYAFIAILIGLIGVAFSIIGFAVHRPRTEDAPLFPPSKS